MMRVGVLSLAGVVGIGLSLAFAQGDSPLLQEAQWEKGKRYLAEGKALEAKAAFEDLLERYPKEPDLHLLTGIASLKLRDRQGAETHIRRALALAPDHAEARTLLGWIRLELYRDYASAIQEYERVARLRPGSPEAHNNLGVAYKQKGDLDKAVENFDRALRLRQDYSEAWSNRGWVYVERKRWGEARSDFERALKSNPQDEGALYGLVRVRREARDYAGAQQALRRLLARSPNFVYWLEWGELQFVRYYWVLLLVAGLFFLKAQVRRIRRSSHGG